MCVQKDKEYLLTTAEVRARLSVSRQTIQYHERRGTLHPLWRGSRKYYRQSEVEALAKTRPKRADGQG
jgi:DNA-binding transcriptional MerR regulator